jgi:hypothetical protein
MLDSGYGLEFPFVTAVIQQDPLPYAVTHRTPYLPSKLNPLASSCAQVSSSCH